MSADFHYVINITTGKVSRSMAPIKIGKYNWLGNNVVIKKDTKTPDYCIVSNDSMLIKDYSDEPQYTFIAGVPGKVKGNGFRRVYNDKYSAELDIFDSLDTKETYIPFHSSDPDYNWFCNDEIHVLSH